MRQSIWILMTVALGGCAANTAEVDNRPPESRSRNRMDPRDQEPQWEHAKKVWQEFAEEHLAKARQRMPEKDLEWVEYRSASIRAFLPDHRIYVLAEYRIISRSSLFVLSRSGQIADLGQGDQWHNSGGRIRNERLSVFLASQDIVLDEPQRVVACVRMIESLSGVSNRVTCARHNGVDFPDAGLFDEDKMRNEYWSHWKLTPRREESAWIVTKEYVGPPARTPMPPVYELAICADDKLIDCCRLPFRLN